jgi:hypothetical protein
MLCIMAVKMASSATATRAASARDRPWRTSTRLGSMVSRERPSDCSVFSMVRCGLVQHTVRKHSGFRDVSSAAAIADCL